MKHKTGDWMAKWYCGNILHFHAFNLNDEDYDYRSQNNSPTLFNRRSINTVGSGACTNIGGTYPAGKISCGAPPLFKCPLKWRGTPYCSECTPLPSYA